jgi:hypothetical protein
LHGRYFRSSAAARFFGWTFRYLPAHGFEIYALDLGGNLRPLIMLADAAPRRQSRGLPDSLIRNQESQAVSQIRDITTPKRESGIGNGFPILRDVTA